MTINETRMTREQELNKKARTIRKAAYTASERHNAKRYFECERELDKIWAELAEIRNS